MLTKEKLVEKLRQLARVFPGIPSYQERESLRAQDKFIRTQLAARLDQQVASLGRLKAELTDPGSLEPLADLDRLCRRLQRLADSLRFASYGYAGLFAGAAVDEGKLAELYDYDLALGQHCEQVVAALSTLPQQLEQWQQVSLADIWQVVNNLDELVQARQKLFSG